MPVRPKRTRIEYERVIRDRTHVYASRPIQTKASVLGRELNCAPLDWCNRKAHSNGTLNTTAVHIHMPIMKREKKPRAFINRQLAAACARSLQISDRNHRLFALASTGFGCSSSEIITWASHARRAQFPNRCAFSPSIVRVGHKFHNNFIGRKVDSLRQLNGSASPTLMCETHRFFSFYLIQPLFWCDFFQFHSSGVSIFARIHFYLGWLSTSSGKSLIVHISCALVCVCVWNCGSMKSVFR